MRGVIDTEAKFKAERKRMAEHVWAEYKANNSANCRTLAASRSTVGLVERLAIAVARLSCFVL